MSESASAADAVTECVKRLRDADDYGESGMDKSLADVAEIREIKDSDNKIFQKWSREGKPRGTPEWIIPKDMKTTKNRVLFLHGGGYAWYSPSDVYRPFSTRLADITKLPVLAIDYRLVPEFTFPAPVEDSLRALKWLYSNSPFGEEQADNIFLVGDSAGGGLTLSTLLSLNTKTLDGTTTLESLDLADIKMPAMGIAVSPYTDLSCSFDSYRTRVWNEETRTGDPVFSHGNADKEIKESQAGGQDYVGKDGDWHNPIASPAWAPPEAILGLPPLLLMAGDAEVMLSDTTEFCKKAEAAGHKDVTQIIYPRMWHDWVLYTEGCHQHQDALTEAVDAIKKIGEATSKFD
eukprot:TRINITY_DN2257_c0_g1_i2.p1 TRINITY_DN2257_c0_g1~~TRINITY_DN2257_c0_g1_i2.p1  ORF type:complete len:361 (+),score=75.29 TRINITY_DN2257_c0_g1_i2:41-1084(+)